MPLHYHVMSRFLAGKKFLSLVVVVIVAMAGIAGMIFLSGDDSPDDGDGGPSVLPDANGEKIDINITDFHSFADMEQELQDIANRFPDITKLESIGRSWEGRDIWAMKISDNPDVDEDEPEIYINGMHHSREWMAMEVPLYIISYLTHYYEDYDEVAELVNSREIWILPCVNPDGRVYDGINDGTDPTNHSTQPYGWRKNVRDNNGGGFDEDDDGVDLNRNYGYFWGGTGSSSSPGDWSYRGPSQFSEPETRAVRDFVLSRNFTISITYHSYSQLILYPWGFTKAPSDDKALFQTIAGQMSDRITNTVNSTKERYTPMQSSQLYLTAGDDIDWLYGEAGIYAFLIELYPHLDEPLDDEYDLFHQNASKIMPVCEDNIGAALYVMEIADNPFQVMDHVKIGSGVDEMRIPRNSSTVFNITLFNDGARDDTWSLSTTYWPPGWSVGIYPPDLTIQRGMSAEASVTITTPVQEVEGPHDITITATSAKNSTAIYRKTFTAIIPEKSDMAVEDIVFSGGESNPVGTYTVDASVFNLGEDATAGHDASLRATRFSGFAGQEIYNEDFSLGLQEWNIIDHDASYSDTEWQRNSDGHSPPYSLWCGRDNRNYYGPNAHQSLELADTIDLRDARGANLSFWTKYDVDYDFDFGIVEVSGDNGRHWDVLDVFTGTTADWIYESYDITDYAGSQHFKIRFRFTSDDYTGYEKGFFIDDIRIVAELPNELSVYSETIQSTTPLDFGDSTTHRWSVPFYTPGTYRIEVAVSGQTDNDLSNDLKYIIIKIY